MNARTKSLIKLKKLDFFYYFLYCSEKLVFVEYLINFCLEIGIYYVYSASYFSIQSWWKKRCACAWLARSAFYVIYLCGVQCKCGEQCRPTIGSHKLATLCNSYPCSLPTTASTTSCTHLVPRLAKLKRFEEGDVLTPPRSKCECCNSNMLKNYALSEWRRMHDRLQFTSAYAPLQPWPIATNPFRKLSSFIFITNLSFFRIFLCVCGIHNPVFCGEQVKFWWYFFGE